jgi:hypothetical protein
MDAPLKKAVYLATFAVGMESCLKAQAYRKCSLRMDIALGKDE